jgi:hypothetical protein
MKDITQREVEIRDEVAMSLLHAIAPKTGPETIKGAVLPCYDVAEHFIFVRRAVLAADKADTEAQIELPLVVKS